MTDDELRVLAERVANGIHWLSDVANDPAGAFHLWFQAGLTPVSPMPAQPAEQIALWQTYYPARVTWERLNAKLEREEHKRGPRIMSAFQWQPASQVRGS